MSPEVYEASLRRDAKNKTAIASADNQLDIKASILLEIFNVGLLFAYLISGFVHKLGGRHGNYTVLPVKLGSESELKRLLRGSQEDFEDYIFGKGCIYVEKSYCLGIVRGMIALDPAKRTQSLKEALRALNVSVTAQGNEIAELRRDNERLENDKKFMQEEVIGKISEFGKDLQSAFGNLEVTLREMVHEIPDHSQYLEKLSESVGSLVDGLQRASEQGDKGLAKETIESLRRSLEDNTRVQKELASESHAQLVAFSGALWKPKITICVNKCVLKNRYFCLLIDYHCL